MDIKAYRNINRALIEDYVGIVNWIDMESRYNTNYCWTTAGAIWFA